MGTIRARFGWVENPMTEPSGGVRDSRIANVLHELVLTSPPDELARAEREPPASAQEIVH